jgi:hypothetical protein
MHTVSPLHVHFVALRAVLPETRIHIHEQLLHVEGQPVDSAVPVLGRVRFERGVQDRQNHIAALRNQRHYFFLHTNRSMSYSHGTLGAAPPFLICMRQILPRLSGGGRYTWARSQRERESE